MSILPINEKADFRIMSANMLFDATAEERAPLLLENFLYYLPDIIGCQEVNKLLHDKLIPALADKGYVTTRAWPNPENMRDSEKESLCKKYPAVNYFPILYRAALYEEIESTFTMYKSTWTYTKGFTSAVFKRKSDGKLFACVNTHAALVLKSYGLEQSDAQLGTQWRADNVREMIAEKDRIIAAYGNIPVFFTGDFNGGEEEAYYSAVLDGGMVNTKYVATESASHNICSFHNRPGDMPSTTRSPIDHVFVTPGTNVAVHSIELRQEALDATDHCLVYADVTI